jgi:multimeric flavodoxin WrbA
MNNTGSGINHSERRHKVLIIYYSFSRQTRKLVLAAQSGLLAAGTDVALERLIPLEHLKFPFGSFCQTLYMMFITFFKKRMPVEELSPRAFDDYDLVIIAGPTWSFNPSGPMLSFLDGYCDSILRGKKVLALISCRRYWSYHGQYLKKRILNCGGTPLEPWSYNHPIAEPWNTIGLFLTLMGKNPKRFAILKKFYIRYGHSKRQLENLERCAFELGRSL